MKFDRKHTAELALLLILFGIGVFIYLVSPDYTIKKLSVVFMALLYPVYGIWHHYDHGHLSRRITWEYCLVGLLVLVSFLGLLS